MGNFILFLIRLFNLYLYFILGACILSWIPNINPEYPLFHYIFLAAGAGIVPPVLGFDVGPAVIMLLCALIMMGLEKLYLKFFAPKEPEIVVITKEQLMEQLKEQIKNEEEKNNGD